MSKNYKLWIEEVFKKYNLTYPLNREVLSREEFYDSYAFKALEKFVDSEEKLARENSHYVPVQQSTKTHKKMDRGNDVFSDIEQVDSDDEIIPHQPPSRHHIIENQRIKNKLAIEKILTSFYGELNYKIQIENHKKDKDADSGCCNVM